jgi:hypothetical protein
VLDDDLGLLRDVARVQVDEPGQRRGGLLLVQLRVVGDGLGELEEALVGRVALEHVEDEALLDGLAHGVEVKGHRLAVGVRWPNSSRVLNLGVAVKAKKLMFACGPRNRAARSAS